MAQDNTPKKLWLTKRFWYSVTPLVVTLIAIGLINLLSPEVNAPQLTPVTNTAVSAQPPTPTATPTRPPILPATILPSPTPSNTPRPDLASSAAILLLGPPPESSVSRNGRLAFYWNFSETLLPGQQFVLTLRQNETIISEGIVTEPNMGEAFQLLLDLSDLPILPGTAVWQLHVEWADTQQQLIASGERPFIVLSE